MGVPVVFSCVGEAQQPTTGRFRQSRRRICRAEIRRTEGVEASALGRETRNTQDNNYYHLRAFEFNSTCIHATRATLHSAQGSSRCRRVEGPLAEENAPLVGFRAGRDRETAALTRARTARSETCMCMHMSEPSENSD